MACRNGICERTFQESKGNNMAKALKTARSKPTKSSKKSALQNARENPKLKDVKTKTLSNKVNIKKPSTFKGTNAEHLTYSPHTKQQQQNIANIGALGGRMLKQGQPYKNPNEAVESMYNNTQWNNPQVNALQNQLFQNLNPQNMDFEHTANYVTGQFNKHILPGIQSEMLAGLGASNSGAYQEAKQNALQGLEQSLGRLKEENQFNRLGAQQRSADIINNYVNSQRGLQANVANAITTARQNSNNNYMNNALNASQIGLTPTVNSIVSPAQPANAVSLINPALKLGEIGAKIYSGGF